MTSLSQPIPVPHLCDHWTSSILEQRGKTHQGACAEPRATGPLPRVGVGYQASVHYIASHNASGALRSLGSSEQPPVRLLLRLLSISTVCHEQ